jgi:enamine deaminase RidA (YjgF/YER057c/UK114 family)
MQMKKIVGFGDACAQIRQNLANIQTALDNAGASMTDVVRTGMCVVDIYANWESVERAQGEVFGLIRLACIVVQVCALIDSGIMVEVDADAVIAGTD